MLRFVARVLIARQHDFCQTAVEAAIHSGVRITSEGRLRSPLPPIEAARLVRNLQALNVFSATARRWSIFRSCVMFRHQRFDRPVVLPDGKTLRTLDAARRHIF